MNCVEIKKTMKDHSDYASAVMNLRYDSITTPIIRYKNFIDNNEIVNNIMKPIRDKAVTAADLYLQSGVSYEVDEIDNLAILYKHLCFMAQENFNLLNHAVDHYALKCKSFNDMIHKLLKFSVLPLIQYIERQLSNIYVECEDKEKQSQSYIENQYNIQQNGDNGTIKDVQNNKSVSKFEFNKYSFLLGILASVASGLIVWGVTELIMFLIK